MNKKKSPLKHKVVGDNHGRNQTPEEFHMSNGGVHDGVDYTKLIEDQQAELNNPENLPPPPWDNTGATNLKESLDNNPVDKQSTYTYMWDSPNFKALSPEDLELVTTYTTNKEVEDRIARENIKKEEEDKRNNEDKLKLKGTPEENLEWYKESDPFYINGTFTLEEDTYIKKEDGWYKKGISEGDDEYLDQYHFYKNILGKFRSNEKNIKDIPHNIGDINLSYPEEEEEIEDSILDENGYLISNYDTFPKLDYVQPREMQEYDYIMQQQQNIQVTPKLDQALENTDFDIIDLDATEERTSSVEQRRLNQKIAETFNIDDMTAIKDIVIYDNIIMVDHPDFTVKNIPGIPEDVETLPKYMIIDEQSPNGRLIHENEVPDDFFAAENLKRKQEYLYKPYQESSYDGEGRDRKFRNTNTGDYSGMPLKGVPTLDDVGVINKIEDNVYKDVDWNDPKELSKILKQKYGYGKDGRYGIKIIVPNIWTQGAQQYITLQVPMGPNGEIYEEKIFLTEADEESSFPSRKNRDLKYVFQDINKFTRKYGKGPKRYELRRDVLDRERKWKEKHNSIYNQPGTTYGDGSLNEYGMALQREETASLLGEDYRTEEEKEQDAEIIRIGRLEQLDPYKNPGATNTDYVVYKYIKSRRNNDEIEKLKKQLNKEGLDEFQINNINRRIDTLTGENARLELSEDWQDILTNIQSYTNPEGEAPKLFGFIDAGDAADPRAWMYKKMVEIISEKTGMPIGYEYSFSDELIEQIIRDLSDSKKNQTKLLQRIMTPAEKEYIINTAKNKVIANAHDVLVNEMGSIEEKLTIHQNQAIKIENIIEEIEREDAKYKEILAPKLHHMTTLRKDLSSLETKLDDIANSVNALNPTENKEDYDAYLELSTEYNEILSDHRAKVKQYNILNKQKEQIYNSPEYIKYQENIDRIYGEKLVGSDGEFIIGEDGNVKRGEENMINAWNIRQEKLNAYQNEYTEKYGNILTKWGYDVQNRRFKPIFKEAADYKQWKNSLPFLPESILFAGEAVWDFGTELTAGFLWTIGGTASDMLGVAEYGEGDEFTYADYRDAVFANYVERDIFGPVGTNEMGIWDGLTSGDGRQITRSFLEGLPFVMAMIRDGRKLDFKGIEKNIANKLFSKNMSTKTYQKIASRYHMGKTAYKATLFQNVQQGRNEHGLSGANAFVYGSALSMITAVVQGIMPDARLLDGAKALQAKKEFVGSLSKAATKEARQAAVKTFFVQIGTEFGEEEVEFLSSEILNMSLGFTDSSVLTDIKSHQELLAATLIISSPFGLKGAKSTYDHTKRFVYDNVHYKGAEALKRLQEEREYQSEKLYRFKNFKAKPDDTIEMLEKRLKELDDMEKMIRVQMRASKAYKEKTFSPGMGMFASAKSNTKTKNKTKTKVDKKLDQQYMDMLVELEKLQQQKKENKEADPTLQKQIDELNKEITSHEAYKEYEGEIMQDIIDLETNVEEYTDKVDVVDAENKNESAEIMEETLLDKKEELELILDTTTEENHGEDLLIQTRNELDKVNRELQDINRIQNENHNRTEITTKERVLIDSFEDYVEENKERAEKEVEEAERKRRERKKGRKELSKDQFDQKVRNKLEREFLNSNEATINIGTEMYSAKDLLKNINELKAPLSRSMGNGAFFSNGYITPEVNGRSKIIINKSQAMQSGYITTGQHEFLHFALRETIKSDAKLRKAMGAALMDYINNNRKNITGGSEFERRLLNYRNDPDAAWEETLPLLSEAMSRGDINENRSVITKFRDGVRQWRQRSGRADIYFNEGKDVFNFIKDYNKIYKSGKKNKAFAKLVKEGAKGNLITKTKSRIQTSEFSKAVKDTFTKFPDMKRDFDKNTILPTGKKKWNSKSDYLNSAEYWDGYMQIMDSKGLTNLIKQGVKSQTGIESPQDLEDFVNKVKEKLTKRYEKNFDPTKANGSLFGWLVGGGGDYTQSTLYRAKGDVMNEYKKQIRAESIDKEIARADQLQNQADESLEAFENQDITKERIKPVKGIKLHERLGPKAIDINKEVKVIASTMDVSDLNFKKLQDLTSDMTQDMFGIKPKPGNLTKVDVKNAQMFINKHADVLLAMLPKGSTASGTSTGVQKVLLDAFYTKSDRTKMAKTGSAAGLAVQVKNDNITIKEFLEVFGITERGEPNLYKKDTNTSSRIKALVAQTGRMLTNQGVREHLIERQESLNTIQRIADGKSDVMFSIPEQRNFNLAKKIIDDFPSIRSEFDLGVRGVDELLNIYELDKVHNFKTKKDIDNFYSKIENVVIPILPKGFVTKGFLRPSRRILPNKGEDVIKVNGKEMTIDQYYTQKRDELFLTDKQRKAKGLKPIKYGKDFTGKGKDFKSRVYGTYLGKTPNAIEKSNNEGKIKEFNEINSSMHQQLWARVNESIRSNPMNATIWGNYFKTVGQMSTHPHRLGAEMIGWSPKPIGRIVKGKRRLYEWEHAMPATSAYLYLLDASLSGGNFDISYDLVMKNFKLIALDAGADLKLKAANLTTGMPKGWDLIENSWWQRYFNKEVGGQVGEDGTIGIDPTSIKTIDGSDLGTQLNINKDGDAAFVIPGSKTANMFSKAVENSRLINHKTSPRGMSAFDFDETLIDKGENTITAKKGDNVIEITSAEWPIEGPKLAKAGYEFDFSDFINVRGGVEGPLMQKFRNRIDKYGIENNYILTARPPESAPAIQAWLAQQGIDMPIENITGLGNSTGEAKALWIANKFAEGYNDIYFVDDALPNVKAVKNVMEQLDMKGSSVQAKVQFSKGMNQSFNDILEQTTGVESQKQFSEAQAKLRGKKGKYRSIIPPSAQDFMGLLYNFMAKGKVGEQQMEFFKKALVDPFARGINELNAAKQTSFNDLNNLFKQFKGIKKKLRKKIPKTSFTQDQAVRVYLWNKAGFEIPGLSKRDTKMLVDHINKNKELKAFADGLGIISKKDQGYSEPGEFWLTENIQSDILSDGALGDARSKHLAEWKQNVDEIFSKQNLNKIEAIYGSKFVEALKDILHRMETGRNRPTGSNRLTNMYMNWLNNSVGAIMFFNIRSATLQTISAINFINWSDNNPLKAGMAFANQPQFWKDFVFLFNSDFLKQRRKGNQRGVNESELMNAVVGSDSPAKAAIAWLLNKGFLPTQIADSFAIASGGATFYRNRVKTYIKQGMDQKAAEEQAFLDFQETTEVSQQSARPDLISQQQANPLGRLILAFQNTPMQYGRIINKAIRDLANKRGDTKTHISKIVYYGAVQAIIFNALQSAIWASLADEDDEEIDKKKSRILNGMVDGWLSAFGYGGKAIGTVSNTVQEYLEQRDKGFRADHTYTILRLLSFSPPIGSKARKIYSSIQTEKFNKDIMKERGLALDNPIWSAIGNTIEGFTNIPLGRLAQKMNNLDNAMDSNNEYWKRIALVMGWNTWDLNIKDPDLETLKLEIKEQKKQEKLLEKEEAKQDKLREKYPDKTDEEIKETLLIKEKTKQVFDLNKREQVKILEGLELNPKDYPKEQDRVNIIMDIYNKDPEMIDSTLSAVENYVPSEQEQRSIDLFKTSKKDQINMLMDLGLSKKQIKELKYEEDRVNKIIELENKNKSK